VTEKVAQHFLRDIPRAKGLRPDFRRGETSVTLLNFVGGQSTAAAQGTAVALGTFHTVALMSGAGVGGASSTADGAGPSSAAAAPAPEYALFACGRGFHGQLGGGGYADAAAPARVDAVERDRPVRLYAGAPDDVQLAVVSAGSSHSASISRRGELYTWGLASSGELGHGGWTPIEVPVPRMVASLGRTRVVSVCAGANHTLAISEAGQLWSCGRGRHGQLGHGHFHDEGVLTLVDAIRGERVVSAAAGRAHSLALAADGKIFTWGDARRGQLGHAALAALVQAPNPQPLAVPFPQPIASLEPAKLRPPQRVTAIAAGGDHSMAVTVGGALLAFGCNRRGQLGTGDALDRMVPTDVPLASAADGGRPVRAMQVQCGAAHTLALVQARGRMEVRAAGDNSYGQLGVGDREARARFAPLPRLAKARIVCICAGDWHCAAVGGDGALFVWGRGDCGQLGLGDDRNRWAPARLAGHAVVHPDRTLRRNRKPVLKTLLLSAAGAAGERGGGRCARTRARAPRVGA
jgi:E3 ubiquitin-protein ligase HERC3